MPAQRRRAFTLVEAIVSVVILATATPAIMWAVREAHRDRVSPVLTSHARWLITEKIEDIIADRHSTSRGYTYLLNSNYPNEATIAGYPGYTRSVSINETGADLVSAGTGYKQVAVTVNWTDARGNAQSLVITTVLTDYTP